MIGGCLLYGRGSTEIEIMHTYSQKKNSGTRKKFRLLAALVLGFGLSSTYSLEAQTRGFGGARGGTYGQPGRTGQADQKAAEALENIEMAVAMILNDNLLQVTPPQASEIPKIKSVLETNKKFQGKFPKESRGYVLALESLIAHYSGNRDDALAHAKRAYNFDKKNPDFSDLIIVLSLCYENYEEARKALEATRKAGSAVLGIGPSIPAIRTSPREPNVPGRNFTRPIEPNSLVRTRPGRTPPPQNTGTPSKWEQLLGSPSNQPPNRTGTPPTGTRPPTAGRIPRANPRTTPPQTPQRNYNTVLNLPVDYIPSQPLGEIFNPMKLRSINGSYFLFTPGQGQILCALLWTSSSPHPQTSRPQTSRPRMNTSRGGMDSTYYGGEESYYGGGSSSRARSPMRSRPGFSAPTREVPPVAFDLDTNTQQFYNLFVQHINQGKACFVGINYDKTVPQIKQMLFEQPYPWSTCLKAESINAPQWTLPDTAGALFLLVDTNGRIRYLGPVGGFLPLMLLDMELAKATTTIADVPDIPITPGRIPAGFTSSDTSTQKKSLLGKLFGRNKNQNAQQSHTTSISPSPAEPNVPVRKNPTVTTPSKITRTTPRRTTPDVTLNGSIPQARQLLRTAQMQRKLTPLSALRSCDEVLQRWPDSTEAKDAKIMIIGLLEHGRLPSDIKETRKSQGKYIGEE
jgi:hypothetical protein